ncbi:MAG: glycoside hydrolase family 57 protein [Myxococcota bacterium]
MGTLHVSFLWHMHQPTYADPTTGEVSMPWVRLHALHAYTDMALALEAVPEARATVNWVPGLMDQLEEAAGPRFRERERWWRLGSRPPSSLTDEERRFVEERFFSLNHERMLEPHKRYRELRDRVRLGARLDDEELRDLQVWLVLGWCGVGARRHPTIVALLEQERAFDERDVEALAEAQREIVAAVPGRWRDLEEAGRAELICSPYYHPILPLLHDLEAGRESDPTTPLPHATFRHPGDAHRHLARALESHEARFGRRPAGIWPSEGAISAPVARLAASLGVRWMVSDEALLDRALGRRYVGAPERLGPWEAEGVAAFFRHHDLSDRIGFVYADWSARAAVRDFVHQLRGLRERVGDRDAVVTVALDGENCWEHYPGGVMGFLPALYEAISRERGLRLSTLSEALDAVGTGSRRLERLPTGSWIDGNLRTWIGDPVKNRAWDLLAEAREAVGRDMPTLVEEDPDLADLIMRAEASDWFWWFGEGHSSAFDAEFDALFRHHLEAIWRRIGRRPPAALRRPVDRRRKHRPAGDVTPPQAALRPRLTGRTDAYYKWAGAGEIRAGAGAIHRAEAILRGARFAFSPDAMSLRVETEGRARDMLRGRRLVLTVDAPGEAAVVLWPAEDRPEGVEVACDRVLEARVPAPRLGVAPDRDERLVFSLHLEDDRARLVERLPRAGAAEVTPSARDLDRRRWSV